MISNNGSVNATARNVYNNQFPRQTFRTQTQTKGQVNSQTDNLKFYFFKYDEEFFQNNVNLRRDINCLPNEDVFSVNDEKWIRFSYDNIVLFGTPSQKQKFHEFRVNYIRKLIENNCYNDKNCNYEIIGSDTAVSDRDITLYKLLTKNNSNVSPADVKQNILIEHSKIFRDTLEYLFDCNIYITTFFFYSKEKNNTDTAFTYIKPHSNTTNMYLCIPNTKECDTEKTQREWAFSKIVKVVREMETDFFMKYFNAYFSRYSTFMTSSSRKILFKKFQSFTGRTSSKKYDRLKTVCDSMLTSQSGNSRRSSLSELVERQSKLSATERDTYNSLGAAFAHVVNHDIYPGIKEHINISMYIDAIIENIGFIGQLALKKKECYDDNFIIIKMAKYLDRVCSSIRNIKSMSTTTNGDNIKQTKKSSFETISTVSNDINTMRKTMQHIANEKIEELKGSLINHCRTLPVTLFDNVLFVNETNTDFIGKINRDFQNQELMKMFTLTSLFAFSYISIYDVLPINSTVGGRLKNKPGKVLQQKQKIKIVK